MAPRESSLLLNWLGATNGNSSPASGGKQQLFHSSMLPLWLATVLARGDLCVAILCGAPCSGKTEAARRMAGVFGELLAIVSDDVVCDAQQLHHTKVSAHPQADFELVVRNMAGKSKVVLYDAGNTQFQDHAEKVANALSMGVKLQNFAWFVFDSGLPENEEVETLMARQQKRLQDFLQSSEDSSRRSFASDGKVTSLDAVRRSVRQIRQQYFDNMDLKAFNIHAITKELLEFSQSQQMHGPTFFSHAGSISALSHSPAHDPFAHFSHAMLAVLPEASMPVLSSNLSGIPLSSSMAQLQIPTASSLESLPSIIAPPTAPISPVGALGPLPPPMAPLSPVQCASLPTAAAHPSLMGIASAGMGGTAMHSNALPTIGLPPDHTWDQHRSPMYFVFADGQTGSQMLPLEFQLSSPSSAASPPFTGTTSTTSSGGPPHQLNTDGSAFAYAFCLSHRPGLPAPKSEPFQRDDITPQPSSPDSSSLAFNGGDLLCGGLPGKLPSKWGRKNGHCNGVTKPHMNGLTSGHGSNGSGNGNANGNGNGHGLVANGNGNGNTNGHSNGNGNGHTNGHSNGNGNTNGNGNGHGNGNGNGQKGPAKSAKGKTGSSDGAKARTGTGKKKLPGGLVGPAAAPRMGGLLGGGPTLRSVLNEYWKTHKLELDASNDFDIKVPAELLAKSSAMDFDDEMMLQRLQALIEESEEFAAS